jgi:hypothetical protein
MYEMEGPRLVSQHVPADCSASFAPLDRTGPSSLRCSGRPDRRWLRVALAGWLRGFFAADPGVAPAATAQSLLAGGLEFSLPREPGLPLAHGSEFLLAGWLRMPPQVRNPELLLRRWLRGPARVKDPGLSPAPGGSECRRARRPEVTPNRWLRGCPRCRVARVPPCPKARGHPLPVAPGLPCQWPGIPFAGWHRIRPSAGGSGLPPYR